MILNILENIDYKSYENNKLINLNFHYNYDLLIYKNKLCLKKIISSLNKITENNYFNIYFNIIDIINEKDLDKKEVIYFIFKKIEQNSFYIDTYINFILLNKNLTIEFINFIQNIFENNLQNNEIIIDIICILYKKKIITDKIYNQILQFLFFDPQKNIDFIIKFYKYTHDEQLKIKILNIPKLSFRYKYKLEI